MGLDSQVGTTTMASVQVLTASYVLQEDELQVPNKALNGTKWLQLFGETQTTLEISYTTGATETNNYVEFYIEFGSGAPELIDWHKETVEYFDDANNQIVLEEWTYKIDGAAAATEYTKRIQLPVCTKGIRVFAKEVGKATNFGTLTIKANTQAAGSSGYNRSLQTVSLVAGSEVDITKLGGETLGDHGTAVIDHGIQPLYEAVDFDGSALPNAVTEGQAVRPKATESGVQLVITVNEDGSAISSGASSTSAKYRATSNGVDGTVIYASASTLTLSGTPFTVNSEDLVYIRVVDATGNTAEIFVNGSGGVHLEISGGTVTKSGGTDFSANGVYELGYNGQDKAYNEGSDAEQNLRLNPDSQTFIGETLADVTNETDATNYYYMDMAGYRNFTLQAETSDATPTSTLTITIEASMQDDGTAAASCAYQDVTNALFSVASWVDTDFMAIGDVQMAFKYIRVKTVTAGGGNDADYTLYAKRMY